MNMEKDLEEDYDWFDKLAMEEEPKKIKESVSINEEFRDLIPPLSKEEFDTLEQSILENGVTDPIQLWNGYIVDGHNRFNICKKHNLSYGIKELFFCCEEDAKIYIINKQIGRRNINAFVKLELTEKLREEFRKKGKENQGYESKSSFVHMDKTEIEDETKEGTEFLFPKIDSRKEIAKITNTSTGTIGRFDKIKNLIDEETKKKLRNDKTTIGKVYKEIKNKEYKEKELSLKDVSNVEITDENIKIYNCDISKSDEFIEDNSLDVIITDPPYPKEFLHCWKLLAEFAAKKLKDGGVLIAMSGHMFLPEVYKNMTIEGLNYYWTGCYYMPGNSSPRFPNKRLLTNWKPLLIYVKGNYTRTFQNTDVYISENYNDTKTGQIYHKWGQSLPIMESLIKDWTYATDIVCDPFLGGGTTGIACMNNKRKFVGIELVEDTFEIAKKRINEYGKKLV